jgi:hypothetical protein
MNLAKNEKIGDNQIQKINGIASNSKNFSRR